MSDTGGYCKAYYVKQLREFPGWSGAVGGPRQGAPDGERTPKEFGDDDYLFIHEDFTVTEGIFRGQQVVLDHAAPEWKTFCTDVLKFDPSI